ncbi:MAG: hypothetical protein U0Q47_02955 [Mycobacterium sp.]
MDGGGGNGQGPDVPWASVFDPAANLRALTGIQAEGFRAASELVDRVVRMVAVRPDGTERTARQANPPSAEQRADLLGATDVEPLIRSWWAMVGQFLMGTGSQPAHGGQAAPPALDVAAADSTGRLEVDATVGQAATSEVWLHNAGDDDLGRIRLRCSGLMADDGSVIDATAIRFEPKTVPMPGRCSRGVGVTIKVAKKTRPGLYRGTVLVEGRPNLWLPIAVTVQLNP